MARTSGGAGVQGCSGAIKSPCPPAALLPWLPCSLAPLLPGSSAPLLSRCSTLLTLLALLLLPLLIACRPTTTVTPAAPVFITIGGSTSMGPLLRELTEAYKAQHPHVTFDVQSGGSSLGGALVESGQLDIGLVSQAPADLSDEVQVTPIARDAIAIILNAENPLKGLSHRELRDIFNGRLINWQEAGGADLPIQVVSREDGSGTRAVFEVAVMEELAVTPAAIVMPNSQAVVDFVAQNPNAIGYVSFAFLQAGVYAVPVEGVAPSRETLADHSYFLRRELALVTRQPAQPEVEAFLVFVLSPAGQEIVGRRLLSIK